MPQIGVGLCVQHSVEAVALYTEAFGLTLGYHVRNDDGSFFHSELYDGDAEMLSVVESGAPVCSDNPVQLGYTFSSRDALLRAFGLLRQGGQVRMDVCELPWSPCAAEVVDRFGVRWYLTLQQHRPPEDFTPADCQSSQDD